MSFCQSIKNFVFRIVKHVGFCVKESVFERNFTAPLYLKETAVEAHRTLVETYGDCALLEITYRDWFRRIKNFDFYVEDKERSGTMKKFEDEEFMSLFPDDSCRAKAECAE